MRGHDIGGDSIEPSCRSHKQHDVVYDERENEKYGDDDCHLNSRLRALFPYQAATMIGSARERQPYATLMSQP